MIEINDMSELPIYSEDDEKGSLGVDIVSKTVRRDFSWIFREQPKNDLGIDAQIEIINDSRQGTGRIIAAQIKAGKSFFEEETTDEFVFRGKKKHLNYWLNHSLPVIIIICNLDTEVCYWAEVNRTSVNELDKGWKILIPKTQTLSNQHKNRLIAIAGSPQHPDIVELSLFKFLQEKYHKYSGQRIDICPLMYEPRDFMYYTCLAEIESYDGYVYIAHHYDLYADFGENHVLEFIRWRELNMASTGQTELPYLFIFTISEKKEKLKISSSILKLLAENKKVLLFRLLYQHKHFSSDRHFYSLTELDENDEEIYMY